MIIENKNMPVWHLIIVLNSEAIYSISFCINQNLLYTSSINFFRKYSGIIYEGEDIILLFSYWFFSKIHHNIFMKTLITWRNLIISLIFTYSIYFIMLFVTIPEVMGYVHGMKILDMLPWYNFTYARNLFDTLGEQGRHIYLTHQLILDLFYPWLFIASSTIFILYFLKKIGKTGKWNWLIIIPCLAGCADYIENIFFTYFNLTNHVTEWAVSIARIFSLTKTTWVMMSVIIFIILLAIFILQKMRR